MVQIWVKLLETVSSKIVFMQLQIAPPQLISESFEKELGSLALSSLDVHISYEFNSPGNQTAFENLAVNHTCSYNSVAGSLQ